MSGDHNSLGAQPAEQIATPPELACALLETTKPFDVDWRASALSMAPVDRLMRLARIRAVLPAENAEKLREDHNITLENYVRLALDAAGDRDTLDEFLGHVQTTLAGPLPDEKLDKRLLAQQVYWIWAPAADIAGLTQRKSSLENTALPILFPEAYAQLQEDYKTMYDGGEHILAQIEDEARQALEQLGLSPQDYALVVRVKDMYSAWQKRQRRGREGKRLSDILGLRVILEGDENLETIGRCYSALTALANRFIPSAEPEDYIRRPKPTGYQGLHQLFSLGNDLDFEAQIRTRAMHTRATTDKMMSHRTYEAAFKVVPGKILYHYNKVPRHYRWRDAAAKFISEHNGRTDGILGNSILFFRPDGNLYRTETGATVIDASFAIHNDRALKTKLVMRGGKPVRLSDHVEYGDVLDITYDKKKRDNPAQVEKLVRIAVTKYANKHINKYWRKLCSPEHKEQGQKRIAEALLARAGVVYPLSQLNEDDQRELAVAAGVDSFEKRLALIGAKHPNGKLGGVVYFILEKCGMAPPKARRRKRK